MDTMTPMGRRYMGQPSLAGGGGGDDYDPHNHPPPPSMQQHQPGHFWYAPPPSSAPSGDQQFPPPHLLQPPPPPPPGPPPPPHQHPPPPMASGPFYPLPPPHYPYNQPQPPWGPLPPSDHPQQPYPSSSFPPPIPPPLAMHPGAASPAAAAGSPHHHGMPPPNPPYPGARPVYPPPAHPHTLHAPPLPPPPSAALPHAYSQPSQTWENPSWHATQGWNYTDSKFHYNNEEDWAAKARAWAAANSATESLPIQPHYMPSAPNNVYHDQYQHSSGPPFTDRQHSSFSAQDQQSTDSATDLHRRVNSSQESSLNSMSYSVTNFPTYDARNEGLATDTSVTPSPPQICFSSSTPINVQEVPSSYSSFSGNKEAVDQFENLSIPSNLPLPVTSVPPGRPPTLAVNSVSREQSHLPYRDQSIEYSDAVDRSQAIEQIPIDRGQAQNAGSANADQGRPIDQGLSSSSVHGWAQSVGPGPVFPHATPVPPGSQFDSSSISSSLPGHPAQVFGRIQGPNFQPGIPPVGAPFAFDAGSSLHPAAVFPLDASEAFNLSERPKKAAVPNWLRDEIIKKKAIIVSSTNEQPNGGSHSSVAEVHDKILRKDELADSKSVDSARSTEEEEDDEDEVDAARFAAINQEIKRVLTDVLLKVTDELFEEIATKVLNEDELEVDHGAIVAKHKDSMSPPQSTTPKSSAKLVAPAATTSGKSGAVGLSLLGSSGGDVLGLANYASDEDSEETPGSSMPFSGKAHDSSDHHETHDATSEHTLKQQKVTVEVAAEKPGHGPLDLESDERNNAGYKRDLSHKNVLEVAKVGRAGKSSETGSALDRKVAAGEKLALESESAHDNGKSKVGQVTESLSKSGSSDVPHDKKGSFGRNITKEVEPVSDKGKQEDSVGGNLKKQVDRDQRMEKTDEQAISKRRLKDHNSKQAADVRESESRRYIYHDNDLNDKKGSGRDKKDRIKEDDHWKRERSREEKEERFREVTRDSHRPKVRQTSSPSARGRNGRDSSLGSPSDGSGEEISETSKKRKLQSSRHSLSPSPTRSRRQALRSPHSKHTQRRHSPYSHTDARRRRRSRSGSPAYRKRSGHDR